MIYLDNAASTKPKEEVIETIVETMKNNYANKSTDNRNVFLEGRNKSNNTFGKFFT